MKTAKEVLDEITKGCGIVSEQYILQAMKEYAKIKSKEQIEICVGVMPSGISAYHPTTADDIVNKVKYAPLPNFD